MLSLIPQCIPNKVKELQTSLSETQDQDTIRWLQTMWEYLCTACPYNIDCLEGQPILPVKLANNSLYVVPLSSPTSIILTQSREGSLTIGVQNVLQTLGVLLASSLPTYVASHSQVVGKYVLPATAGAALQCIEACEGIHRANSLTHVSVKERDDFRSFITRADNLMVQSNIVCSLPIFPTIQQIDLVKLIDVNVMAPKDRPTISISHLYLSPTDKPTVHVVRTMGFSQYSMSDFLTEVVLPQLGIHNVSSQKELNKVIQFIRDRWYQLHTTNFVQILQVIPFVPTDDGSFRKPQELADPESAFLMKFYNGESGKFPVGAYTKGQLRLFLLDLGLKDENSVSAADILDCARQIQSLTNTNICDNKACAILEYLDRSPNILYEYPDSLTQLHSHLKELSWVPVQKSRPKEYPTVLTWYDGPNFVSPDKLKTCDWSLLIGAVMPVCKYKVSEVVASMFGWDTPPPLAKMIQQLKEVTVKYDAYYKARFLNVLGAIYDQLAQIAVRNVEPMLVMQDLEEWVWCGEGFTSPRTIVKDETFSGLQPYLYPLPPELKRHENLLMQCGMSDSCTPNVLVNVLHLVKHKHEDTSNMASVRRDLQMVVNIVTHLAYNDEVDDTIRQNILLPLHSNDGSLKLEPLAECVYCDREWFKHEGSHLGSVDDEEFNFIHENVPMKTAEVLRVPSLMSRILDGDELDIAGCGQHEPVTRRLRGILENYRDGFAISKEIVQNADDAGARVVKFLYDERTNEEYRERLIAKGMSECQGPALWAYNDALFTEEDFVNITKLGAGTKEQMAGKIGKFGLGFNAVYNITDVPSFVSGEQMVIFDPHRSHLIDVINDPSKPGIKVNLTRNLKLRKRCHNQFAPFNNIFGYDLQSTNGFQGTLFRLPLRTREQTICSEISKLHYSREEMLKLLTVLAKGATEMLLFTQHVKRVELYHLASTEKDPSRAVHVITVTRNMMNPIENLLLEADMYTNNQNQSPPMFNTVLSMIVEQSKHANDLLSLQEGKVENCWLVSWGVGKQQSLEMARNNEVIARAHLTPLAATAVCLQNAQSSCTLSRDSVQGVIYCFLPLPIMSGLPVHINAAFAVKDDRQTLCFKTVDDKENSKADWNNSLLSDAVVEVYLSLLQNVTCYVKDTSLFQMWPVCHNTKESVNILQQAFYARIVQHPQLTPVHVINSKIINLADMVCMHPDLVDDPEIGGLAKEVMVQYFPDTILMPRNVLETFVSLGHGQFTTQRLFDEENFYRNVFFPNILSVATDTRDRLVLHALQKRCPVLNELLASHNCIPVEPEAELRKPSELLNPKCDAACLYTHHDKIFPSVQYTSHQIRQLLMNIGMKCSIDWQCMLERAGYIMKYYKKDQTNEQVQNVHLQIKGPRCVFLTNYMRHLDKMLTEDGYHLPHQKMSDQLSSFQTELQSVPILLPMLKPYKYPMPWKNEEMDSFSLITPNDAHPSKSRHLVSSVHFIVEDKDISSNVRKFLSIYEKLPNVDDVMYQLEIVSQKHADSNAHDALSSSPLETVCMAIYEYLDKQTRGEENDSVRSDVYQRLSKAKSILVDGNFYPPQNLSFMCIAGCQPYLLQLPRTVSSRCGDFFRSMGVQEHFDIPDYMKVLHSIEADTRETAIATKLVHTVVNILGYLVQAMKEKEIGESDMTSEFGKIYIPNGDSVLRDAKTLCFMPYEFSWLKDDMEEAVCVHSTISPHIASSLGVLTQREAHFHSFMTAMPFGQHENLTNRLKRIVSGYPWNHEILKELIQNADDAAASEIHFILDPQHHPTEKVFEESWKSLQGPALCVYNNRPFTEDDIDGIQKLGQGSKETDPIKTGQYGIGFNAMYHLTDTPLLLTDVPDVGQTLCVFDPHCSLVKGEPGIKFEDLHKLRHKFTDFFEGFLEEHLSPKGKTKKNRAQLKKSTIFRFPLRNEMGAESSAISNKSVSTKDVKELLDQLQHQAKDILIFLHNLKEIKISEITDSGKLKTVYCCNATTSDNDREKQIDLFRKTKTAIASLKAGSVDMQNINSMSVMYTLNIKDNFKSQKWIVAQQLGFTDKTKILDTIQEAVRKGNLALSPRGGVAYCLQSCKIPDSVVIQQPREGGKVFCCLPMPLETDLPVHINGHFALGYENRRHVWTQKDGFGYKADWNDLLCQQVISECYLNVLQMMRDKALHQLNPQKGEENVMIVQCPELAIRACLQDYQFIFPKFSESYWQWNTLTKAVYTKVDEKKLDLLPVIRQLHDFGTTQKKVNSSAGANKVHAINLYHVYWLSTSGCGEKKLYFSDTNQLVKDTEIEETNSKSNYKMRTYVGQDSSIQHRGHHYEKLQDGLLGCGLFLVYDPHDTLLGCFQNAKIDINILCPQAAVDYLKLHSAVCTIKSTLPVPLNHTVFQDKDTFLIILKYCALADDFMSQLDGLPLLLTSDEKQTLQIFDGRNPVFVSKYHYLIPQCSDQFLHESVLSCLFSSAQRRKQVDGKAMLMDLPYFKEFDVTSLAGFLAQHHVDFANSATPVVVMNTFDKQDRLICEMWKFIMINILKSCQIAKPKEDCPNFFSVLDRKSAEIQDCLEPLQPYCLLPVLIGCKQYIFPMNMAKEVLTFIRWNAKKPCVFTKLPMPFLSISRNLWKSDVSDFMQSIVEDPMHQPRTLLQALVKYSKNEIKQLNQTYKDDILHFFQDTLHILEESKDATLLLRDLPLYKTFYADPDNNDSVELTSPYVYTLPASIPKTDMEQWKKRQKHIFLQEKTALERIYSFIGCHKLTAKELYVTYILEHFEYLSSRGRLEHLQYVYENYISKEARKKAVDVECEELINKMKTTAVVEDDKGKLQTADNFFDSDRNVFRIMRHQYLAPVKNVQRYILFQEQHWLQLLREIGLVTEISTALFVQFAREVAKDGEEKPSDSTERKSKALIEHLFKDASPHTLHAAQLIRFIPCVDVGTALEDLHPSAAPASMYTCLAGSYDSSQQILVWTECCIIPDWAHPQINYNLKDDRKHYLMNRLSMEKTPPASVVVAHLHNVSSNWTNTNDPDANSCKWRRKVFKEILAYLDSQEKGITESILDKLRRMPCVLVEDERKVVQPSQTVLNMDVRDEIRPYLYKVPVFLAEYHTLLQKIGATESATSVQFANVLRCIFDRHCSPNNDPKLKPTQAYKAADAMRGFFGVSYCNIEETDAVSTLFLLSESRKLLPSTQLVFNNSPSFYVRCKTLQLEFLVELVQCSIGTSPEDLFDILPRCFHPKILSSLVTEVVDQICQDQAMENHLTKELSEKIGSEELGQAVRRLICHESYKRGQRPDVSNINKLVSLLPTFEVKMVDQLATHLVYNQNEIKASRNAKSCFMQVVNYGSRSDRRIIYIQTVNNLGMDELIGVTEEISQLMDGQLQNSVLYLQIILQTPVENMEQKLDKLNIRKDFTAPAMLVAQRQDQRLTVPSAGLPVHTDEKAIGAVQNICQLEVGDCVAYKAQKQHEPVYAFIQKLAGRHDTCYIDIGQPEQCLVQLETLYLFQ